MPAAPAKVFPADDDLLTQLVVLKRRWVTSADLDRAVREQERRAAYWPLSQVLLEHGSLTAQQLAEIVHPAEKQAILRECSRQEEEFWAAPVGRDAGRYRLLEEVGRGGRGVVFRARDGGGQIVAVKLLAPRHAYDIREFARFELEIEAQRRTAHPGVIPVRDVGWCDTLPFFVMEFATGRPLTAYLDEEPSYAWVAGRLAQVARTLDHIHRLGVVHRDLKPDNLLVAPDGTVRLMDFGVAQVDGRTVQGNEEIVGTPCYMSPEQARGDRVLTPASDIYSLGATLYEMITGVQPAIGRSKEDTLRRVVRRRPREPRRIWSQIPRDLESVVLWSMARVPARRYPDAAAMAGDLEAFAQGGHVRASRRPRHWLERWIPRRRGHAS